MLADPPVVLRRLGGFAVVLLRQVLLHRARPRGVALLMRWRGLHVIAALLCHVFAVSPLRVSVTVFFPAGGKGKTRSRSVGPGSVDYGWLRKSSSAAWNARSASMWGI